MKVLCFCALGVLALTLLACSTNQIPGSDRTHVHASPALAIGERYHAAMKYYPDRGKITITFYNDNDRSVELFSGNKVNGEIRFEDTKKPLSFTKAPKMGRFVPINYSTSRIETSADWLRELPNFALKFRLPIKGTVLELNFAYAEENVLD